MADISKIGMNRIEGLTQSFNDLSDTINNTLTEVVNNIKYIPDYTQGVNIVANTNFTAPSNGLITINITHADHAGNTLVINGVTIYSVSMTGSYDNGALPPATFIVGKDDVILANNAGKFYPFK